MNWTTCTTGQYQLAAPTATMDRVCTSCTGPCGEGTYESQACANGNVLQDRECTPLTNCMAGQYMSVAPTATSDRTCLGCATCGASQYETQACANGNTMQNRTCAACDPSCAGCDGAGATHCTSCRPGGSLSGGQCTYMCTLTAVADGMSTNYGGNSASGKATDMRTANDGVSYYRSYVRFDVAGGTCAEGGTIPAGATIVSATLAVYHTSGCASCSQTHDLRRVTSTWSDDSIPTGAGPSVAGTATTSFTPGSVNGYTSISGGTIVNDVQSFLTSSGTNYGWRFTPPSGPGNLADPYVWATHENTALNQPPRLVISYR